jgi:uncharacterized membrane protein YfcA
VDDQFWLFVACGFLAQIVDGALSMAYGVTASSLLALSGVPPAITSATVHAAESITTGFALLSHRYFGNIDWRLFRRLLLPGIVGAVTGAYILTALPGDVLRPYVAAYLLAVGVMIAIKAFRPFPPVKVSRHFGALGFGGAFVDAIGGGGWGPIVASTLIVRSNDPRTTIGSVAAVEFFVTIAASLTFLLTIGFSYWTVIAGLAFGGALAAPLGAYACRHVPRRPMMLVVSAVIVFLSVNVLARL